jgi:hypothetical protein
MRAVKTCLTEIENIKGVMGKIRDLIPKNTIVYGEIIGWSGDSYIQEYYTYNVPKGNFELFPKKRSGSRNSKSLKKTLLKLTS